MIKSDSSSNNNNNNNGGFIFTVIGLEIIIVHWNSIINFLHYFPLFSLRLLEVPLHAYNAMADFLYLSVIAFFTTNFSQSLFSISCLLSFLWIMGIILTAWKQSWLKKTKMSVFSSQQAHT